MVSIVEIGKFPIPTVPQKDSEKTLLIHRIVATRLYRVPPTWKGSGMPQAGMVENGLQIARQIASASPRFGPKHAIVANTGFLPSSIGFFLGIYDLQGGVNDYQKARAIEDREGNNRAKERIVSGSMVSGGTLLCIGGNAIHLTVSLVIGAALVKAAEALMGVGWAFTMGIAGFGLFRCHRFRARLADRLKDPAIPESLRYLNALDYLKNTLCLSEEERAKIVQKIEREHPNSTAEEKTALIEKKIYDRTEVKMKYLKRRTSQKALFLILQRLEPIAAKLLDPQQEEAGIAEARQLIADIKGENNKKMLLWGIVFLAAAIGFIGFVAGFFTAGAIPFLIGAISTAVYLALFVHAYYQEKKAILAVKNNQLTLHS